MMTIQGTNTDIDNYIYKSINHIHRPPSLTLYKNRVIQIRSIHQTILNFQLFISSSRAFRLKKSIERIRFSTFTRVIRHEFWERAIKIMNVIKNVKSFERTITVHFDISRGIIYIGHSIVSSLENWRNFTLFQNAFLSTETSRCVRFNYWFEYLDNVMQSTTRY